MEIVIPKRQTYIVPDLLLFKEVEERLDVRPSEKKITWTDQTNTERNITELTDTHAANLSNWLMSAGLRKTREIIQGELERRCTNSYPEGFEELIENYKSHPETWRLKIYG